MSSTLRTAFNMTDLLTLKSTKIQLRRTSPITPVGKENIIFYYSILISLRFGQFILRGYFPDKLLSFRRSLICHVLDFTMIMFNNSARHLLTPIIIKSNMSDYALE